MDELFRFVIKRPANPAKKPHVKLRIRPDFIKQLKAARTGRIKFAQRWLTEHPSPVEDKNGYMQAADRLAAQAVSIDPAKVGKLISDTFGKKAATLVKDAKFERVRQDVDTTLFAASLAGPVHGVDVSMLSRASRGLAIVEQAANGVDANNVHLVLPTEFQTLDPALIAKLNSPVDTAVNAPRGSKSGKDEQSKQVQVLKKKLDTLASLSDKLLHTAEPVQLLHVPVLPMKEATSGNTKKKGKTPVGVMPAERLANVDRQVAATQAGLSVTAFTKRVTVGTKLASEISNQLQGQDFAGFDPKQLPDLSRLEALQRMSAMRMQTLQELAALEKPVTRDMYLVNGVVLPTLGGFLHVGSNADALPVTAGQIKPVGVGDLMLVREHIKGYAAGEVGHIENILRSEKLDRKTRRLERTENTVTVSVETNKEQERDSQTTDRYDLKRETENTVKTDTQLKGELNVDAKYGPMVEVKADVSASTQTQTEAATKTSAEFSKEVVSRSVSKVSEKIRRETVTKTINEFEEWYEHGFDNTASDATNIAGVYQWVDKLSEAQIYNYGKRLLFDTMVPEPSRFYVWAQSNSTTASIGVTDPGPFTLQPAAIHEGNYQSLGAQYGATDLEPPPLEWITVSKAFDMVSDAKPHAITKSDNLSIPDGYIAKYFEGSWYQWHHNGSDVGFNVFVGRSSDAYGVQGMTGSVPVSVVSHQVFAFAMNIVVSCRRSDELVQKWREGVYSSLRTAWLKKKQDYDEAVAAANAEAKATVTGRNPETNKQFVLAELRKACIAELTAQQYDAFGAIESGPGGIPQLDLNAAYNQGKYIRFFEEAFEWEHIAYYFYPYYWGQKTGWKYASLYDDSDPEFGSFLRAGAARVVFPVRPGFEKAVIYFLSTGQIWNGGDPPDISSSEYVPIVEEISESLQHPGDEIPVGDSWEVRTPTTLVKLREDGQLPKWQKQDGQWLPAN